jgi:hypothetical protein
MSPHTASRTSSVLPTSLLLSGLLGIFIGERIFGAGTLHTALVYGGLALCVAAVALRARAFASAQGDVRGVEGRLLAAYGGAALALLLYACSTDWGIAQLGLTGTAAERVDGVFSVLWLAVMLVSLSAVLFMEIVYLRMPIAESVELRRVRTALHAGLTLALSAVFLLSVNYVATARDVRKDVSYFRTTEPSAATLAMVEKLDKPMRVLLFFRPGSDVLGQIKPYFDALSGKGKKLRYEVIDVALAPELASKHKVRDNGNVLLLSGEGDDEKGESFRVGNELTEARGTLRKLDGTFQQTFNKLVRPERTLYLTVGHGERNAKSSELPGADGTQVMEEVLKRLNLKTQTLGVSNGLGSAVPDEASAVLIVGPTEKFLPEEVATLLAYARKGGKLFLMLDPDLDLGLEPLLAGLGVELLPGTVASESQHMARAHNESDRGIIVTNRYTSHPTVTTVTRHQREVATVLVNGVALKASTAQAVPKPQVTFPLRSGADSWRDLNGNWKRDPEEKSEVLNLMAAVTLEGEGDAEGRAVIIGDGDVITNKVAQNNGNMLLFVDSLAWLVGNEDLSGEVSSEEDRPIEHSSEQNKVWFYATTFAVPAPILLLGAWVARGRRKRAESKS